MITAVTSAQGSEFLTFSLGADEYGIDLGKVEAIHGADSVNPSSDLPGLVKGSLRLRGIDVPVFDLRSHDTVGHCRAVIVLQLADRVVGLIVDNVSGVRRVAADQVRPAAGPRGALDRCYVAGTVALRPGELILLDAERLSTALRVPPFDELVQPALQPGF